MNLTKEKDTNDHENDIKYATSLLYTPCFRQSMLWGLTGSFILGIHRFRTTNNIMKATNVAILSFLGISSVKWIFCRQIELEKRNYIRNLEKVMAKHPKDRPSSQFYRSEIVPIKEELNK